MCIVGRLCLPCPMCAHVCSASAKACMDTDIFNLGRCLPRRTSGNAAVNQQSQFRLPLSLAGAHATHADQEAVTAGRAAPALQHLQRLLGQNRKKTTQQAALSSCWKQLFLRPPGALLPRGAAPRPHATPWTQAALSPKRGGCVDSPLCHAEPARAKTHPPLLCNCQYASVERNESTHCYAPCVIAMNSNEDKHT